VWAPHRAMLLKELPFFNQFASFSPANITPKFPHRLRKGCTFIWLPFVTLVLLVILRERKTFRCRP
jgi:hypothetical protein